MDKTAVAGQLHYARDMLVFHQTKLQMQQMAGHCTKFHTAQVKRYTEEVAAYGRMLDPQLTLFCRR